MTPRLRWWTLAALAGLLFIAITPLVQANTPQPQIHIGRLWMAPEYDGAEGWSESCWQYPAAIAKPGFTGASNDIKRGWAGQGKKWGTYMWSTNWTAPDATNWAHAMSFSFRSMNYDYPNEYLTDGGDKGNMNYNYAVSCQEYLRWDRPEVTIVTQTSTGADSAISIVFFPGEEGLDSVVYKLPDNSGILARPAPIIDPTLVAEEVVNNKWRYIQGVEFTRDQYAYPFGSAHQDYILNDVRLWNNGISGNHPEGSSKTNPTVANNNVENMVYGQAFDSRDQSTDGIQADGDAAVVYPFGASDHPAVLCWDTDDPNTDGPDWGDPTKSPGYNRPTLIGNCYVLLGCVYASSASVAHDASFDGVADDASQPNFMMATLERGVDLKGDSGYPPNDPTTGPIEARIRVLGGNFQLDDLSSGNTFQSDSRFADVVANNGGPTVILGYGTKEGDISLANFANHGWDLPFGNEVRIVQLYAGGGIDNEEAVRIASYYRAQETASAAYSDWMTAEDIALIQTGQDTAMKAAAMAYWNFNGQFPANVTADMLTAWNVADYVTSKPAAQDAEFNVPEAPRPPEFVFAYAMSNMNQVVWGKAAESAPDHDTNVNDLKGYRVYRQEGSNNGAWELVADFESYTWAQERAAARVADVSVPAGRYFNDNQITPGTDYHYCVVAYDDGTQNWAQPGVSLESTRWWTWTGYSGPGVTAPNSVEPGDVDARPNAFALAQNAPNPFNPTTSIQFSVPTTGVANLVIYNAAGQVVRTLVDGVIEAGSHQISWDGMDNFGRSVASGVYMYRLTSGDQQTVRRMTLVR